MSEARNGRDWGAIVRRQWWLVAAVALVAAVVGAVLTAGGETTYTGQASLIVDTNIVARYNDVPVPEALLKDLRGSDFREAAAQATGLDVGDLSADMDSFSTGSPQDRVVVTYTSTDRNAAEGTAGEIAVAAVDYAQREASASISQFEEFIALTEQAISDHEAFEPVETPMQTAEDAALAKQDRLYNLRIRLLQYQSTLTSLENAYRYDGDVEILENAASTRMRNAIVGLFMAGLAVGLVLAAFRENLIARAARRVQDE